MRMFPICFAISMICFGQGVLASAPEVISLDEENRYVNADMPRISANGHVAVFSKDVRNFIDRSLYARIRGPANSRTVRINENYLGTGATSSTGTVFIDVYEQVALNANGRYVVFSSNACDLASTHPCAIVDPALGNVFNVYRRDLELGVTRLVSQSIDDGSGNHLPVIINNFEVGASSTDPLISDDGRWVAFESFAIDLYDFPSHSGYRDIFLRDMDADIVESRLVTAYRTQECLGLAPGHSWLGDMTPDGRFVVFVSNAPQLKDCSLDPAYELFIWDRDNPQGIQRTGQQVGTPANIGQIFDAERLYGSKPSISDDGAVVAFVRIPGGVSIYDRATGISRSVGGGQFPIISGDGQVVVFQTFASLVPEDLNFRRDVYAWSIPNNTMQLVSVSNTGVSDGDSTLYLNHFARFPIVSTRPGTKISWDGRYVAFNSRASNLVDADTNNVRDVFVRDMALGETQLVSEVPGVTGTPLGGGGEINLDKSGRVAVFQALAHDYLSDPLIDPFDSVVLFSDLRTPIEAIEDLQSTIIDLNLQKGLSSSLDSKLIAISQALDDINSNNDVAAIGSISAFINAVEAQRGVNLTNEEADQLIAAATAILNLI